MFGNNSIEKTFLIIMLFVFNSIGFAQDRHKTIDVEVFPYKSLSYGAFFKNLTLKTIPENIGHIDGFEFEWGYRYKLKVKETTPHSPPMDGSSVNYKLIIVISKTKASSQETFDILLEHELYLGPGEQTNTFKYINDSTYSYFEDINMLVKPKLIDDFKRVMKSDNRVKGKFIFKSQGLIELIELN